MENDILNLHFEIESLNLGETTINGANIDFSTDDSEIANKVMYLIELITSVITMKGRSEK